MNVDILAGVKIPLPPKQKQAEVINQIDLIHDQAKELRREARKGLEQAKHEVEAMIFGRAV